MKRNTKPGQDKLSPELADLIRGTHGLATRVALHGGFNKSFATRVMKGEKRASKRFLLALDKALSELRAGITLGVFRHEHPEIEHGARR